MMIKDLYRIKQALEVAYQETNSNNCEEMYKLAILMTQRIIDEEREKELLNNELSENEIEYLWQSSDTPRIFAEKLIGY
jgi:hypothetical protein